MDNMPKEEVLIDITRLIRIVLHKSIWIILVMIFAGSGTYYYLNHHNTPSYKSSGRIYIIDDNNSKEITVSLEQLDVGSMLVQDYKEMITSRLVLEQVISQLNLDVSYGQLKGMIQVDNPEDTRILCISIQYNNPENAQRVLNQIEKIACSKLSDKMGTQQPTILEKASLPEKCYPYAVKKLAVVAAIAGGFMLILLVCAADIFSDKIRTVDDINRHFQINTFGSVEYIRENKISGSVLHIRKS